MGADLILVPGSNCCIFIIHFLYVILALVAWMNNDANCDERFDLTDGATGAAKECTDDPRCEVTVNGGVFVVTGDTFTCALNEECVCSGIGTMDPAFTLLIACGLFFFVKILIELYLIWCAQYLTSNNFKQESKKIMRLSESVWLRCVQCRAPTAWLTVMNAYESGHFYAFKERVFWLQTFLSLVFMVISVVAFVQLSESEMGIAVFYVLGLVLTLLLMLFSCFVKKKYVDWSREEQEDEDEQQEMTTR
eukprot:CAMPEP_0202705194 /NCGR_PEP_ID=MMETSP1385-20130828/17781_1 /ASSEMBLY_ACC=CAM_ASM_000861 /TAXON_ID=933848 /ORGANISM="Elphidium margaritaceum" /LENGTH=248 /DNA_ID=CAMNT_0049363379 /DNA_START=18 /DNA_END=764 /DNA_ORIENTATION=-